MLKGYCFTYLEPTYTGNGVADEAVSLNLVRLVVFRCPIEVRNAAR